MENKILKLYCDGGVHGGRNPGTSVYYSVGRATGVDGVDTEIVIRDGSTNHTTNNEAEYLSLIAALQWAFQNAGKGVQRVIVHMDSELIVKQFSGAYGCYKEHLIPLRDKARGNRDFLNKLGIDVDVVHVRRKVNVQRLGH